MKVEFKPAKIPDSDWFAVEIFVGDESIGYVHFIETTTGQICRVNALQFARPLAQLEKTALGVCLWFANEYKEGRIK